MRKAKALGLNPRKLPGKNPGPQQRWKAPVAVWIRQLYERRFGHAPAPGPRTQPRPQDSSRPDAGAVPEAEPREFSGDDEQEYDDEVPF